jgi:hypothetical protein
MMKAPPMPSPELASLLRTELLPGERLVWSASPAPLKQLQISELWIWLFGIPWTALCLFFEAMVSIPFFETIHRAPSAVNWGMGVASLFFLPWIAVGFVLLWSPFETMIKARRTVYGLTDRRMLRVTAGSKCERTSVMFQQMGPIDVQIGSKGYGNVRIQTGISLDFDGDLIIERFEVIGVPDVVRLNDLLRGQLGPAR